MKIGLLVAEKMFEDFSGVNRLVEAAISLGHEPLKFFETDFSFVDSPSGAVVFYDGHLFVPPEVVIVRPNFTEEPSHHQAIYDYLKTSGCKLINGEVLRTKNKLLQRHDLLSCHLPLPSGVVVQGMTAAVAGAQKLGFPVVIKVPFGTRGKGIFFAPNIEVFRSIVDYLLIRDSNPLIIEKYITEANNSDVRLFVIGNKVAAAMLLQAPPGEIRSNAGGVGQAVKITAEEIDLALRGTQAMNLQISGVDLLRSNSGSLIMEVNANPGFKELERVTGLDIAQEIIKYAVGI